MPKEREARRAPAGRRRKAPLIRPSKLDAFAHLVGVDTDAVLARKVGLTPSAVTQWRQRRGIPSAAIPGHKARPVAERLRDFADKMGILPDGEVARLAGVHRDSVLKYRHEHGIAPVLAQPTRKSTPKG
jgi:hypothetical protein